MRFDLIARLCPNSTGAELRSVATEVNNVVFTSFSELKIIDNSRLVCLLSERGGRLPLNGISWTPWKRSFDKEPNFPARQFLLLTLHQSTTLILSFQTSLPGV